MDASALGVGAVLLHGRRAFYLIKWCQASRVVAFHNLRELIVLEEVKNRLPERIVIYLSEQKVTRVTEAAVLADEFLWTHKSVFSPPVCHDLVALRP